MSRWLAGVAGVATVVSVLAWLVLTGAVLAATVLPALQSDAGTITIPEPAATEAPGATSPPAIARAPTASPSPAATLESLEAGDGEADDGELVPPVDFPELPDLKGRTPDHLTEHFEVFREDPDDDWLLAIADRWTPEVESILATTSQRLGRELQGGPVRLVFARSYAARCPARGLASPLDEHPYLAVFVDESTTDRQVRAVLAHEMAHHLTLTEAFVGDGVLTEGLANWGAEAEMLPWQDYPAWDHAVFDYLAAGTYVSVADPDALRPVGGESCIARRDRIYNIRTAFVGWLIDGYGLETVLQMPAREIERVSEDGEPYTEQVPDYRAVTGMGLEALELAWLVELWTSGGQRLPETGPGSFWVGGTGPLSGRWR